jgi:VanZ family protein
VTAADPPAAATDRRATAAFVAVVLLSLVVLFWPHAPSEHAIPNLDKLVHAALFAMLAAATWWRFGAHRAALVAVIVYGGVSELIQWRALAHRDGDVRDVAADAAGALLGWLAARRFSRKARRGETRQRPDR